MDLGKIVYKKLEDGSYIITVNDWNLEAGKLNTTTNKVSEDYIQLKCVTTGNRPVVINLFEKSLDIVLSNVINHCNLEAQSAAEVLDFMKGRSFPAYHQTVLVENKTYYNWYICSEPKTLATNEDGPAF